MRNLIEHLPRLRRYARALTGDRYAGDDLVQDTLERALSRFAFFRQGSKLDSWLLTGGAPRARSGFAATALPRRAAIRTGTRVA